MLLSFSDIRNEAEIKDELISEHRLDGRWWFEKKCIQSGAYGWYSWGDRQAGLWEKYQPLQSY